jgi:hypothetical protein
MRSFITTMFPGSRICGHTHTVMKTRRNSKLRDRIKMGIAIIPCQKYWRFDNSHRLRKYSLYIIILPRIKIQH